MSVHEQHAQAAAVNAERLEDPACREYIERPIRGNDEAGERYCDDEQNIQTLGTGIHGGRGAYNKLLLCYFEANIGYRAIRYDAGMQW